MKRWLLALSLGLAGLLPTAAQAQTVGSYPWRTAPTPTLSPYLNLTRGGSAGINYFSLVRPQIETQKSLAQINQELMMAPGFGAGALGTSTGFGATSGFTGQEGSAAVFLSYGPYFPLMPQTGINPLRR
jgi:hypothetical protein